MKTTDFNFELPQELIAQTPIEKRDHSRLLYLSRGSGEIEHHKFYELPDLLNEGDLLILNDSKVLPARLFGEKIPSGGAMQFLLLEQKGKDRWEILVRPGRKARVGTRFSFGDGRLIGEIVDVIEGGNRIVDFTYEGEFFPLIEEIGLMPLPEYITETLEDKDRYQTVYADELGSAAAPTAGLHFTPELLSTLKAKGIDHSFVTLHVGLGTFRPVKADDIKDHTMHSEHYSIPKETEDKIRETKARGGRIIAVGTTACRTLESAMQQNEEIIAKSGDTSIFIYPGYSFKIVDGIITNFHLPMSTLIMLVSAFAGKDETLNAYEIAVKEKYKFYSFGDAMIIL